jgi:hypothetical protein
MTRPIDAQAASERLRAFGILLGLAFRALRVGAKINYGPAPKTPLYTGSGVKGWTPERCERQAELSRRIWADPEKRQRIVRSMREASHIRRIARLQRLNASAELPFKPGGAQ